MNRGLIEAAVGGLDTRGSAGLPRFMNRGLIEARGPLFDFELLAPLPRFMNRGLIEALPKRRTTGRSPRHFPDS